MLIKMFIYYNALSLFAEVSLLEQVSEKDKKEHMSLSDQPISPVTTKFTYQSFADFCEGVDAITVTNTTITDENKLNVFDDQTQIHHLSDVKSQDLMAFCELIVIQPRSDNILVNNDFQIFDVFSQNEVLENDEAQTRKLYFKLVEAACEMARIKRMSSVFNVTFQEYNNLIHLTDLNYDEKYQLVIKAADYNKILKEDIAKLENNFDSIFDSQIHDFDMSHLIEESKRLEYLLEKMWEDLNKQTI